MKLILFLIGLVVIVIVLYAFYRLTMMNTNPHEGWEIEPREIEGGQNAVYLVRGEREVRVGAPFNANDEFALDERLMDARRMRKGMVE